MGDRGLGDSIAISLEGQRGTIKVVGLPGSAAKQIAEVLPFELEAQLPFDIEEAVFDHRLLPGLRETKGRSWPFSSGSRRPPTSLRASSS